MTLKIYNMEYQMDLKIDTPKVTIITTVYNKEELIHKCINSVLNQNLKDFEYILVDDESPDKCPEICDAYAEQDNRVRVIHRKNGGHALAYNTGIIQAKGEYIMLVDADDYLSSNDAVVEMLQIAEESKCEIVVSDFLNVWDTDNQPQVLTSSGIEMLEYFIKEDIYHPTTRSRLFSRSIFEKVGLLKDLICDDEEWTPRAFSVAEKISIYPQSIYVRTTPEDSVTRISTEKNLLRKAIDRAITTGNLLDFFETKKLSKEDKKVLYKRFISLYLSSLYLYTTEIKDKENKDNLKHVLNKYHYVLNYTKYYKNFNHNMLSFINKIFGLNGALFTMYLFAKIRG